MTTDVNVNTAIQQASQTQSARSQIAGDFDDFLSLLTTQLQNQDPLSPMDSTEFTNQLVAFSEVEQLINQNSKLDNLVSLGVGNSATSALAYVGKDVSFVSSDIPHDGESSSSVLFSFSEQVNDAVLTITDSDGKEILSVPVEGSVGNHEFTWDGKDADGVLQPVGTYNVIARGTNESEVPITADTVVEGRVRGIEVQNGLITLLVGERAVPVGAIINVQQPSATSTATITETTDTETENETETEAEAEA